MIPRVDDVHGLEFTKPVRSFTHKTQSVRTPSSTMFQLFKAAEKLGNFFLVGLGWNPGPHTCRMARPKAGRFLSQGLSKASSCQFPFLGAWAQMSCAHETSPHQFPQDFLVLE